MATMPQVTGPRRIVLVDLDWQDTDLLPELFRQPGVSVRLVAGQGPTDPGCRVADLCGLPRTFDLADLTREIFDLALVGEHSTRRTQLESLLLALGTPCQTPEEYRRGQMPAGSERPGVDAPLALHAAAMETSLSGAVDAWLDQALPDLTESTPLTPRPPVPSSPPRLVVPSLADFPSRDARRNLEEVLLGLAERSGAAAVELHSGDARQLERVLSVGSEDKLLQGLVQLANESGTPQMVTRLNDPGKGRTWAAWPFRTLQRQGVLAGAGIDTVEGLAAWQNMVEDLKVKWDHEDRERIAPSFPLTPQRESRWLTHEAFRNRLDLAVDRHSRDGMRFELLRLECPENPAAMEAFASTLPARLRDSDCLARPFPTVLLLLACGSEAAMKAMHLRLETLWDEAWRSAGIVAPSQRFRTRSATLAAAVDSESFRSSGELWLVEE